MKNKILITVSFLFFLSIHADENKIKQKIEKILPSGAEIESIQPSKFPGIYKVFYGDLQPIYVSSDGSYFIYGDMFEITPNKILNLTDKEISSKRKELILGLDSSKLISFPSDNEIYAVTVFTDVECGYCRKLHKEIEEYNNLGISINYAAFPRSGIGTNAFTKMVGAWCSNNPQKAITSLKKGNNPNLDFCDTQPVSKHYAVGQKIGITGTPAIITSDGNLLPGYIPPDQLLELLKS